jgi:hypothetical protein
MNSGIKRRSYSFLSQKFKFKDEGNQCGDLTKSNCKCCLTKQRTFTIADYSKTEKYCTW